MPRTLLWTLYALLVCIWSSTWVVFKIGLQDLPPLFGAGLRFSIAGAGLLLTAVSSVAGDWHVTWSREAVGSIAYLALIGSAARSWRSPSCCASCPP